MSTHGPRSPARVALVPVALIVGGVVLAVGMPELDRRADLDIGLEQDPDSARSALSAMASGMIAFTGFVFSAVVLVVQFGSSAFSPRLLRVLRGDLVPRLALGVFTATFLYALVVTQNISSHFLPSFSLIGALLLLLASVVMLLALLYRLTDSLRATAVIRQVGNRGRAVIEATYSEAFSEDALDRRALERGEAPLQVVTHQGAPAYLLTIDRRELAELAGRSDAQVRLLTPIGDHLHYGRPLFEVDGAQRLPERDLCAAMALGDERTIELDPPYAFRLLVDIANNALSPAINDPTTAVQVIDQIEDLPPRLAFKRLGIGVVPDSAGVVRFSYPTPLWEDYLSLAVDEIRRYGRGSLQIVRRLRALLEDLHATLPERRRPAIEERLARLESDVERFFINVGDRGEAGIGDRQGLGSPHPVRQASPGGA